MQAAISGLGTANAPHTGNRRGLHPGEQRRFCHRGDSRDNFDELEDPGDA